MVNGSHVFVYSPCNFLLPVRRAARAQCCAVSAARKPSGGTGAINVYSMVNGPNALLKCAQLYMPVRRAARALCCQRGSGSNQCTIQWSTACSNALMDSAYNFILPVRRAPRALLCCECAGAQHGSGSKQCTIQWPRCACVLRAI